MPIDLKKIKHKNLAHFRFKQLDGKFLLTNDIGEYIFLSEEEFKNFTEGKLDKNGKIYKELVAKSFVKSELDLEKVSDKYAKKNSFLFSGPSLHIFVVTLRCNNKCVYCYASAQGMKRKDLDMSIETAQKALDLVFKSPNKFITIEFQGGEPLANWPVIEYVTKEARKRNKKHKKDLELRMVSNFNLLTKEKLDFLLKNKVGISGSLDGPKELHDKNRVFSGGSSYKNVAKWTKEIKKKGKTSLMATATKESLAYPMEIVDAYLKLGLNGMYLRPLFLLGEAVRQLDKIGYSPEEYLDFYRKVIDYVIELNLKGTFFKEEAAVVFLSKILAERDPNNIDYRLVCGAGVGNFSYDYNGDVHTCFYGRSLSAVGDDSFKAGDVNSSYQKLSDSPVLKTMCSASCMIGLPGCNDCAYLPYCGVCAIHNYVTQRNIFGQMPNNERCKISKGILDYLFEKMQDEKVLEISKNWIRPVRS